MYAALVIAEIIAVLAIIGFILMAAPYVLIGLAAVGVVLLGIVIFRRVTRPTFPIR